MRVLLTAALLIAVGGCGISKDKYAAKELEAQQNMKKYTDESQKTADLEKKVASLEEQLAASRQEAERVRSSAAQLAQEKGALEQEKGALEARSAQYEQLAASLKGQIAAGQVEISEMRGKMTVKLRDRILFASGSAALNKNGRATLAAVADAFKGLQRRNVIVAGYTDDVPIGKKTGWTDNWDLSTARAVTVVRYLQRKGVDPSLLGAAGFSEYRPLATNDSVDGRSHNRRIEIALTAADYSPPVVDVAR